MVTRFLLHILEGVGGGSGGVLDVWWLQEGEIQNLTVHTHRGWCITDPPNKCIPKTGVCVFFTAHSPLLSPCRRRRSIGRGRNLTRRLENFLGFVLVTKSPQSPRLRMMKAEMATLEAALLVIEIGYRSLFFGGYGKQGFAGIWGM